MKMTDFYQLS